MGHPRRGMNNGLPSVETLGLDMLSPAGTGLPHVMRGLATHFLDNLNKKRPYASPDTASHTSVTNSLGR